MNLFPSYHAQRGLLVVMVSGAEGDVEFRFDGFTDWQPYADVVIPSESRDGRYINFSARSSSGQTANGAVKAIPYTAPATNPIPVVPPTATAPVEVVTVPPAGVIVPQSIPGTPPVSPPMISGGYSIQPISTVPAVGGAVVGIVSTLPLPPAATTPTPSTTTPIASTATPEPEAANLTVTPPATDDTATGKKWVPYVLGGVGLLLLVVVGILLYQRRKG